MIWHYFPIGMRFPVRDFSDETRRACWELALSAVFASDARGTGLYEACESFDPGAESPVYTCIVCYVGIKQSRAAGKTLHALDRLTARLCLHRPLVQANYLEGFGPYPILGEVDAEGRIIPSETGAAFLPTGPIEPMRASTGPKLLLAPGPADGCNAEARSRVLGTAAADRGFRVKRLSLADGGEGTVRALVIGTEGRYETVVCEDAEGVRTNHIVGVIPGPIAVLEAFGMSADGCAALIRKTLDLGYRRLWIAVGETKIADLGLSELFALEPRLAQSEVTLLYRGQPCGELPGVTAVFGADRIEERIGLSAALRCADAVVAEPDLESLLKGDPNRRDVIASPHGDLENAFERDVLPLLAKDIANGTNP